MNNILIFLALCSTGGTDFLYWEISSSHLTAIVEVILHSDITEFFIPWLRSRILQRNTLKMYSKILFSPEYLR